MHQYARLFTLCAFIVATTQTMSADKIISLTVRPSVIASRGSARLQVLVERDTRNRLLIWEVDGTDYYRSSRIQLDAEFAPRSWLFVLHDLPRGEYDIRVTLRRNDNSESLAISRIRVMAGMLK